MPAAHVQGIGGSIKLNADTLVMPGNVTAGNHIVILGAHSYIGCPPTVADSQSNTYTKRVDAVRPTGGGYFYVWTAPITSSGACTITLSMGCGQFGTIYAAEVSGLDATTPYGGHNVSPNTANPVVCGSITPTVNGSYLAAIFFNNSGGTFTAQSGWDDRFNATSSLAQTLVQTTAASITPEATASTSPSTAFGYTAYFNAAAGASTFFRPYFITG